MKLVDIFEALAAAVHTNPDKTLMVLPHLVQHDLNSLQVPCSSCLFIQILHTISAVTDIPAEELARQVKLHYAGEQGHTLEELFAKIQSTPIKHKGHKYTFKLGANTYKNIDAALAAVNAGQPVIAIIQIYEAISQAVQDLEYRPDSGGILNVERHLRRKKQREELFHTLLIIGYDSAHDHVIMRETRSTYGYKGYVKVSKATLKKHPKLVRKYLSITVEDVKKRPLTVR